MYERSRGIWIEKEGVWSSSVKPPIWKSENEHGWHVSHCASEAAIFMLWALVTASPKRLPTISWRNVIGTATISASFTDLRKRSTLRPRRRCQQLTPSMTLD